MRQETVSPYLDANERFYSGKFHLLATLTTMIKPGTVPVSAALPHSLATWYLKNVHVGWKPGEFIIKFIFMKNACKELEVRVKL